MQLARTSGFAVRALTAIAALSIAACQTGSERASGPLFPPAPPENPMLTKAAFVFQVNTSTRQVAISAPTATVLDPSAPAASAGLLGPNLSLIAGDAITLTASNYFASTVGQFAPGKIRVRFDLSITNKLSSVQLITPTFPTAPPGVTGVLLFPFATYVTVTSGGVSVGGAGDSVIVVLPNVGQTAPSVDWDGDGSAGGGAPYNFFNDAGCGAGSNDCYRYEAYASPVAPGATTLSRTVGFDIDPTVANFQAKIIVAADLQNAGAAPTGTISGAVTSPQRPGGLTGVTLTANVGGFVGTSGAGGAYTITNVTTGPKTVTLTTLPVGCTDPGPQSVTVNPSATSTLNVSVTCTVPSGTVSGTISRTGTASPALNGTVVTATPAAAGTTPSSVTLAGLLTYSIPAVQIGTGTGAGNGAVALSNLPSGCTSAPGSYTGLTLGGTQTVNFTVNCVAPPSLYQYTSTWGPITAGTVTLTLRFDPTTLNSPTVNGAAADDFKNFQADVTYSPTRLTFSSCANGAGSTFSNVNASSSVAGTFTVLNFKNGAGELTPQVLAVCTFNVGTGAATSVTPATSFTILSSFNGDDLAPNTQKTEGTLTIP